MTETDGSGADATRLQTTAVLDGDEWVIEGRRWVLVGSAGAGFGIVVAATVPDRPPRERLSQLIVPTPDGSEITPVRVLGQRGRGWSTHCEARCSGVRAPAENVLRQPRRSFALGQARLVPGRIHHASAGSGRCAFGLICARALEREPFGGKVADKQTMQNWIADSAAEAKACQLLTFAAADAIDRGDDPRVDISLVKVYAARALYDLIDRAVQVHGGHWADRSVAAGRHVPGGAWSAHLR
jgi:acyl-CoA dehydrogenase